MPEADVMSAYLMGFIVGAICTVLYMAVWS